MSLKKLPPTAVNQKDPGFDRFSRSSFEWRFAFFLSRSVEQKTGNLIAQPLRPPKNDHTSSANQPLRALVFPVQMPKELPFRWATTRNKR
jgi:hypothetical protein